MAIFVKITFRAAPVGPLLRVLFLL